MIRIENTETEFTSELINLVRLSSSSDVYVYLANCVGIRSIGNG
jgi:hypothetical protein